VLNGLGRIGTIGKGVFQAFTQPIRDNQGLGTIGKGLSGSFGISPLPSGLTLPQMGKDLLSGTTYGQGKNINVTVNMGVGDPVAVGKQVRSVLDQFGRRTGSK